jgi:hypothetical protein
VATLLTLLVVGWANFSGPAELPVPVEMAGSEAEAAQSVAQVAESDVSVESDTAVPAPVAEESGEAVYIPLVSFPLDRRPETAVLDDIHGFVEIQDEAGEWTAVSQTTTLAAGQRLRTGAFSHASLTFYDGSQAQLGPKSELSLDAVDAQLPENGFRTVVMTQWLGESEHDVQFRNDSGSRYEVKSPNGTGIARGTTFQVLVTADLRARYTVIKGRVDVTGLNVTVFVTAGQTSAIPVGAAPTQPAFRVSGQGIVSQIGPEWVIGGQSFLTDDQTITVGNPQVGDWVRVEGHLLDDGARLADRIILLHRTPTNNFTITGQVDAMGVADWTVAGQAITVAADTTIESGIIVGDVVQVDGVIQADGSLLAENIHLIEANAGLPFEFTGVVQTMTGDVWNISGINITTDADTEIEDEIVIGDVVDVEGWILADDTWLAGEIKLAENNDENRFEITGSVESIDPWIVAGIPFETRDWTEISDGIAIGDLVKVEGAILADGIWAADEIKRLDDENQILFTFYGQVDSIDPWVVAGITLPVTGETAVDPSIIVGDLVQVTVRLLPDGTWVVERIILVYDDTVEQGCFNVTAVVISLSGNQIILNDWPTLLLNEDLEIDGDITSNSVVTVHFCINETGTVTVITIIVIFTPGPVTPPPALDDGSKVTICHKPGSKNQHTLTVSQSALSGHLNHGDTIGACSGRGGDGDDDDDHD